MAMEVHALAATALPAHPPLPNVHPMPAARGDTFGAVLERISSALSPNAAAAGDVWGVRAHRELAAFQQQAAAGKQIDAKDLLLYQIKAGEFNLRVEMFSKIADSFLGTVKKLQSQP